MSSKTEDIRKSYLAFRLDEEIFAVGVAKVLEILEMQPITKVPKTPKYMRGVINMRGEVIPVVDTRLKFNMPMTEDTIRTVIIVLELQIKNKKVVLGAIADSVNEVMEISDNEIREVPDIGSKYNTEFIMGMVKSGEYFIMILDIDKVFSMEDITMIKNDNYDSECGEKTTPENNKIELEINETDN
ncbi:MAG: chemotaxis protein CheW [Bacteroidota bacterium]|nr:chemotaxis protein CheW [Bacteroidota bacterium]